MRTAIRSTVSTLTEGLETALQAESDLGLLRVEQVAEVAGEAARLVKLAEALLVQVLRTGEASDLSAHVGMTSLSAHVSQLLGLPPAQAKRFASLVRDGEQVPAVEEALAAGEVGVEQASAITAAVLPLPVEVQERAAAELLGYAETHHARLLAGLGKHIHAIVDPEFGEALLERQLEAEERRHEAGISYWATTRSDGAYTGSFTVDAVTGAMIEKALHALTSPDLPPETRITREGLSRDEIRGRAFVRLVERLDPAGLPAAGGVNATVVVTMTLDQLQGRAAGAAVLNETGQPLSASSARRLACSAGVIPLVLGGRSEVLDLGRARRLFTAKQRVVMEVRQRGVCAVEGCSRPTAWCEAHHLQGWAHGGRTDVDDGVLICKRHHTLIHQPHLRPVKSRPGEIRLVRMC